MFVGGGVDVGVWEEGSSNRGCRWRGCLEGRCFRLLTRRWGGWLGVGEGRLYGHFLIVESSNYSARLRVSTVPVVGVV